MRWLPVELRMTAELTTAARIARSTAKAIVPTTARTTVIAITIALAIATATMTVSMIVVRIAVATMTALPIVAAKVKVRELCSKRG